MLPTRTKDPPALVSVDVTTSIKDVFSTGWYDQPGLKLFPKTLIFRTGTKASLVSVLNLTEIFVILGITRKNQFTNSVSYS